MIHVTWMHDLMIDDWFHDYGPCLTDAWFSDWYLFRKLWHSLVSLINRKIEWHGLKKILGKNRCNTQIVQIFGKWASSREYGTYHIGDQQRLRRACICAVSPEPSLFIHMKYGSRRRVWQKIRHLSLLYGCVYAFEEWVYGGWKMP